MAHKNDYFKEIGLKHHEVPAKVDLETGEVTTVESKKLPLNQIPFGRLETAWKKSFTPSWMFLELRCSELELKIVRLMVYISKPFTNSLEPLSDDMTIIEMAEFFKVDRRKLKKSLDKLFNMGVYGRFEVVDKNKGYTKYWLLNPYISFEGSLINSDIKSLFDGTEIALAYKSYTKSPKYLS